MKILRGAFGAVELIEATGYVATFFLLLILLLSGHIPRDYELWVGAALGGMLPLVVTGVLVQRRRGRHKS